MDIRDAFVEEAFNHYDTNIDAEEEDELRGIVRVIFEQNAISNATKDVENVAVLCFIAGRTFQAGNTSLSVEMTPQMLLEWTRFLISREEL